MNSATPFTPFSCASRSNSDSHCRLSDVHENLTTAFWSLVRKQVVPQHTIARCLTKGLVSSCSLLIFADASALISINRSMPLSSMYVSKPSSASLILAYPVIALMSFSGSLWMSNSPELYGPERSKIQSSIALPCIVKPCRNRRVGCAVKTSRAYRLNWSKSGLKSCSDCLSSPITQTSFQLCFFSSSVSSVRFFIATSS